MPSVDNTLGAVLIGSMVSSALYGITCLQSFIFFQNASKDTKFLKWLVSILFSLDTVHIIFITHFIYWYTITKYGDVAALDELPWSLMAGILITTTSDTAARCFFTWRIWILSRKNRVLCVVIGLLLVLVWFMGMAFGIYGILLRTWDEANRKLPWILYLQLSLVLVSDFSIATSQCYFLYKSRTSINHGTNSIINVLMLYTINTGLATSLVIAATLITYAAIPDTFIFLGVYFAANKFYFNALLATLNVRKAIQSRRPNVPVSIPASGISNGTTDNISLSFAPAMVVTPSSEFSRTAPEYKA